MKQSSIEFLFDHLPQIYKEGLAGVFEDARYMQEWEIMKAHSHGRNVERGIDDGIFTSEEYYQETFNTKEK